MKRKQTTYNRELSMNSKHGDLTTTNRDGAKTD